MSNTMNSSAPIDGTVTRESELVALEREVSRIISRTLDNIQDDAKRCRVFLHTWVKVITPRTPTTVGHLSATNLPVDAAFLLLKVMGLSGHAIMLIPEDTFDTFDLAWPSMWIHLLILRQRCKQAIGSSDPTLKQSAIIYHRVIVNIISGFTLNKQPTTVFNTIAETSGIFPMIGSMWVDELKDESRTFGYYASTSLCPFLAAEPHVKAKLISGIFEACGGSAMATATTAFQRVSTHCQQPKLQCAHLKNDINFILGHTRRNDTPLYHQFTATPDSLTIVTNVMSQFLNPSRNVSSEKRSSVLVACTEIIFHQLGSPHAYHRVLEALREDLVSILLKASALCTRPLEDCERFKFFCLTIMKNILPQFLTHRACLSLSVHTIVRAQSSKLDVLLHDVEPFASYWSTFEYATKIRIRWYNEYKSSRVAFLACGNPECERIENNKEFFLRCSGCTLTRYCSRRCQKQHWISTHGPLCKDVQARNQDMKAVSLSNPDLNFLTDRVGRDYLFDVKNSVAQDEANYLESTRLTNRYSFLFRMFDYNADFVMKSDLHDSEKPLSYPPFKNKHDEAELRLQAHWRNAFRATKHKGEEMIPVVVVLARGSRDDPQVMSALITSRESFNTPRTSRTAEQDKVTLVGVSWLHSL